MDEEIKYSKFDVTVYASFTGIFSLFVGVLLGSMATHFDMKEQWAEHAAKQCWPKSVYASKLNEFSFMCADEELDRLTATR